MPQKIAIIGECMLELSHRPNTQSDGPLPMALSYGGDTLNTSIYLARLGIAVDYVTAVGDDNMSTWMMEQWRSEGVGCELVDRYANSVPGLYMIEIDERGERSFHYWRDSSPARRIFDDADNAYKLFTALCGYEWLYLSGITLALYSESSRQRLFDLLVGYRKGGGKIIFDDNYRPKLWPNETVAQENYKKIYQLADIALPTIDDERLLFGDRNQEAIVSRLQSWGVGEIALKMGEHGCLVVSDSAMELVKPIKVTVIDTTSAGDSFNAGYLAARMIGHEPREAANAGQNLASVVIQHRGAIIPSSAMPQGK
ncbi:MAG: sugar kinase [Pseudomonadales bacterium]